MKLDPTFFLSEAAKSLRVNLLMSITAATTTFVCVLILGTSLVVGAHVQGFISSVEGSVSISAFFPLEATTDDMETMVREASTYPEVKSAEYVSEAEAVEEFRRDYRGQPEIYSGLESGVLPGSLELTLHDPEDSLAVAARLQTQGFPEEEIRYPQRTIEQLSEVTGYVLWGLRGATALFIVASMLLISNSIRLSIFARRKEIEVMKLVGASDSFVSAPFVLEGLAQGVFGALVAAVAVVWADHVFVGWAEDRLPVLLPIAADAVNAPLLLLILASAGAGLGVLGSLVSIRRFLRV